MSNHLDQLFRQHHHELSRFAYSRLGCSEDAADVVQDAFVRYANMKPKENAIVIETPRFFLSRIIVNLIIDKVRREKRRGVHSSIDEMEAEIVDPQASSPENIVGNKQQLAILVAALDELSPNVRQAILLNRVEGYTHKEISKRLNVSPSMVCKYIMKAIKHCAKRLGMT